MLVPGFANAFERIRIRDNEVIAVKFDDSINVKTNRRGDEVRATVDGDRYLPEGTKLIGEIREIRQKDGDRKAFADVEFTEMLLPNGQRVDIRAYPVPLGDKYVSKNRDGHMEAKKGTRRDNVVIGGTLGGLILGSIFKKPLEGTIIGALGGILIAETDAMNTNGEKIVEKGQKLGAAFDGDVTVEWNGRYDRGGSYDDDRDRDRDNRARDGANGRDGDSEDRSGNFRVECDGRDVHFQPEAQPYKIGSTIMVPLEQMAKELGFDVSKTDRGIFYVEDEENSLKLEQNGTEYRLNGKRSSLPRAVVERDGVVYVPIEAFAALKRDSLKVNGTRVIDHS